MLQYDIDGKNWKYLKTNKYDGTTKKTRSEIYGRVLNIPTGCLLTLSCRRSLPYRNHIIDLQRKAMDWFLYDRDLRHERVKHGYL